MQPCPSHSTEHPESRPGLAHGPSPARCGSQNHFCIFKGLRGTRDRDVRPTDLHYSLSGPPLAPGPLTRWHLLPTLPSRAAASGLSTAWERESPLGTSSKKEGTHC